MSDGDEHETPRVGRGTEERDDGTDEPGGGPTDRDRIVDLTDGSSEFHPEYRGSNVFGLARVRTPDGPHLLGTVSKFARIVDFTADEVVYDFSDFGDEPRAGGDSFGAVCAWKGGYYFGGWVIAPSPTDAFDVTDKYAYLLRLDPTKGFGDGSAADPDSGWEVILADRSGDHGLSDGDDGWAAEVGHLHPTPSGVYVNRADDGGSGVGVGVYRYDGEEVTRVAAHAAHAGTVVGDEYVTYDTGAGYVALDVTDDTARTVDVTELPRRTGGTEAFGDGPTELLSLDGAFVALLPEGIAVHDERGGTFAPLSIRNVYDGESGYEGSRRAVRSDSLRVAGGVLFALNDLSKSPGLPASDPRRWNNSWLVYLDQSGPRIVDTGKWFAGMAVFDDRVYLGTASSGHGAGDTFAATMTDRPGLTAIPLSDLKNPSRQPAVRDRIDYANFADGDDRSTGVGGVLGGYPAAGYDEVAIELSVGPLDAPVEAELVEWGLHRDATVRGTHTFEGGDRHVFRLSEHFGGIVGVRIRTDGAVLDTPVTGTAYLG